MLPERLTRREALKLAAIGGFAAVALPACGGGSESAGEGAGEKTTLKFITWETYDEQPWLDEYTKKTGVKLERVVAGSVDELFTKTKSGSVKFDLTMPDSGSIQRYKDAGIIEPLDLSKLKNVDNITDGLPWKDFATIDDEVWAIPYNWGTQPLMYNADEIKTAPTSWQILWDPQYKGKVAIPDDAYITIPMISLAIGQEDIFNLDDAGYSELRDAMKDLRTQVTTLSTGFNDQLNQFANGQAVVGYCQNISEVFNLQDDGHNIQYVFPDEGVPQWADCFSITPAGKQSQVAYDLIDEHFTVPWQSRFIEFSFNNGILSAENGKKGVKSDVLAKTNILDQDEPGFWDKMVTFQQPENFDKRIELWNEFKTGA